MFKESESHYRAQSQIFKALAHPTRLFIVEMLSRGELCVCEITAMVEVDISTISKHLSILKNTGIIEDSKRGQNVYYKLKMPCVLNFFSCIKEVLKSKTDLYTK